MEYARCGIERYSYDMPEKIDYAAYVSVNESEKREPKSNYLGKLDVFDKEVISRRECSLYERRGSFARFAPFITVLFHSTVFRLLGLSGASFFVYILRIEPYTKGTQEGIFLVDRNGHLRSSGTLQ